MKKFLIFITTLFVIISCDIKVTGYNYNKVIAEDKAFVDSLSRSDSVKFCEAQGRFAEPFIKDAKEYEIIWMQTVFQVDTLVYILKHPDKQYGTEPIVEIYEGIWIGDLYSPIETEIDLKEAIINIRKSKIDVPESEFFVLRRPIVKPPFPEYMYYIFGSSQKGAIKVDSNSGEVTNL